MDRPFYIGKICVTPQTSQREVQFCVSDEEGYLFRLVPIPEGFAISKLDRAVGHSIDPSLVALVSFNIENHYS